MPDTPKQPVTVGDLLTIGVDRVRRPATVADLVSALRAEGVLGVARVDGEWAVLWDMNVLNDVFDALAQAQPFPPAGG